MRTVAIIQARMGSSRLPGKVLAEAAGKPLLQHMIERLMICETLDDIVVAMPKTRESQPIASLVADIILEDGYESKVGWVGGDELDVLSRVLGAARTTQAELIVELTGDCPLIDPWIVDRVVHAFHEEPEVDFCANNIEYTYPRGMDVRVFPTSVLERVDKLTQDPADREHVSLYIWEHPDEFRLRNVEAWRPHRSDARLTVDTPEDLAVVRAIFEGLYPVNPKFRLGAILNYLYARPKLLALNAHIQQKAVR